MSSSGTGLFFYCDYFPEVSQTQAKMGGVTNIVEILGRSTYCQVRGIELYKSLSSGSWGQLSPSNGVQGGSWEKEKKAVS